MTSQEKQDKSSAESLEMAEDDRLESEFSEEEQMVLEEQPMLVASDNHDSALVTKNLDNPETFPVTKQEKQKESSTKALEMLQNNRSEMEAQEQATTHLKMNPLTQCPPPTSAQVVYLGSVLFHLCAFSNAFWVFPVLNHLQPDYKWAIGMTI